jgi:hypothetical protein
MKFQTMHTDVKPAQHMGTDRLKSSQRTKVGTVKICTDTDVMETDR